MEQIINYRDIPTDKRIDILNALERIGFFPAYGGVKTMQQIMEKSVPGSGPQFYFVFRENELIGYNFLIGDTKKYKAFPWLAISNMDEQKLMQIGTENRAFGFVAAMIVSGMALLIFMGFMFLLVMVALYIVLIFPLFRIMRRV